MAENPMEVVKIQAEDEGLWFITERPQDVYLQAALRRLHRAIEGKERQWPRTNRSSPKA